MSGLCVTHNCNDPECRLDHSLTTRRVEERLRILFEVDTAECSRCDRPIPESEFKVIAEDPQWFIDTILVPNESAPGTQEEHAQIFCPRCW